MFKRDVSDVHDTELNKLKLQYLTSLESAIAKASAASDLKGALALRNEQKRFGDTNVFPEQDEAADAASVKQLRAAIRVQFARLEKENAARAKALHAKYDQVLAQAQAQLTQRQRLDDAVLVQTKREEVAATWITPAIKAASEKTEAVKTPPVIQKPAATQTDVARSPKLIIISAIFGIKKSTVDTTKRIQAVYDSGEPSLALNVRETAEGKDPAPSLGKETTITYIISGKRKTKTFREGYNLVFKDDLR